MVLAQAVSKLLRPLIPLSFPGLQGRKRRGFLKRPPLALELLEDRIQPSVSAQEQLFVYLLNRARHDPVAYQIENNLPVDLSGVARQAPLAVNDRLSASAQFRADEMAAYNYYAHQSSVTGKHPNQIVREHGYEIPAHWPNNGNYLESVAAGYPDAAAALKALIIDEGVPNLGHRVQLLAMDAFFANNREIGVGFTFDTSATYWYYWVIHTAQVSSNDTFLTGVVYKDLNNDSRYSLNEGLAGVTVKVGNKTTVTNTAGGWSIAVQKGTTCTVTVTGGTFVGTTTTVVNVGNSNVAVDFISGRASAFVNFAEVPATFSNGPATDYRYVESLYQVFLKAQPSSVSPAALNTWANQLTTQGRTAVVQGIVRSPEAASKLVEDMYLKLLGRPANGSEHAGWVNMLVRGYREEQVMAGVLSSPEFAVRAASLAGAPGAADENYVRALYALLLGRTASNLEVTHWVNNLPKLGRHGVAMSFTGSVEFRTRAIVTLYAGPGGWPSSSYSGMVPNLLNRPKQPSEQEVALWMNSGLDLLSLKVAFASSQEFYIKRTQ